MVEELYIIKDDVRYALDLNSPSGITLNFKSNIFGDLSKISASYSYTFKLPMTSNNRRVLDMAEDIRHSSNFIRRKLKCEFIQNGIPLYENANLYIDSVEDCYNAVMTWGVIPGMDKLKDEDVSLRELNVDFGYVDYSSSIQLFSEYNNESNWLKPVYDAGLPFRNNLGTKENPFYIFTIRYPLPVVPVYRLIKAINEHFGTRFELCGKHDATEYDNGDWCYTRDSSIFSRGVVPLVNAEWSDSQKESASLSFITFGWGSNSSYCGISDCLFFEVSEMSSDGLWKNFFSLKNEGVNATRKTIINQTYNGGIKYEIDGCLTATFSGVKDNETPELVVYMKKQGEDKAEKVASISGDYQYSTNSYNFNFSEKNGRDRLQFHYYVGKEQADGFSPIMFLAFSHKLVSFEPFTDEFKLYFYPVASEMWWNLIGNYGTSFPINVVSMLPDISCFDFIKTLFFMAGGFPIANQDGSIGCAYFSDFISNLKNDKIIDWSNKVLSDGSKLPLKISYSISGFAQKNTYKMNSDKDSSQDSDQQKDVYQSGVGIIELQNGILEKEKNIVKIPFNAPYILNKRWGKYDTGNTFKFWYLDDSGHQTTQEADPICGLIQPWKSPMDGKDYMEMVCWNEFKAMDRNESYNYLKNIAQNVYIITEELQLNEFDIRDLDYSVPVYLEKYNSYFAIVSIQRNSKGISKCELLKLPEEE